MTTQKIDPQIKEHVGEAGIISDDDQYDIDKIDFSKPVAAAPDPNAVKEVKIRVPGHIPNNVVHNAVQVGLGTVQRIAMDIMVIAFPSVGKGAKGEPVPTIGKFEMIIGKPEDVKRILELAHVINTVNSKIADAAATNPAMVLSETIEGTKMKDEALRQLKAGAEGFQPIQLATEAPRARVNRGKIEIAK